MRFHGDYDRFCESKYYIRNKHGAMRVAEELLETGVDTVKISTHNETVNDVLNALILAGYSLYNKTIIEDMTYLVFSK